MLDSNSSLTVATTTAAAGAVLVYYYTKKKSNARRPPVVSYTIPWIGSAVTLGKDPDAFFQNAREKYGDIFTVQAAGMRSTYVTSAAAISAIYRNSKSFVFTPTRLDFSVKMFDMSRSIVYDNEWMRETMFPMHHRVLASSNVTPMVDALIKHSVDILEGLNAKIAGKQWNTTLEEFAHKPIFRAISAALLGPLFPAEKSYEPFLIFDDYIPFFAAGAPTLFVQKGIRARNQLIAMFEEYLNTPGWEDEAAELVTMIVDGARNESQPPWTDRELAASINSDYWAANGNMTWGFFWTINLMLHEPQSLAPLYEELDAARDSWLRAHPGADLSGANLAELIDFLNNASLPLITSTVSETLRVSSSSFSIRTVVEDGAAINGYPQFEFSKGDVLVCQARSVHLDQEIYGSDAATFKPDRFVNAGVVTEGGSRKPFLAFGGGVSQCEGRHFAAKGSKFVMALYLLNFDIKLDPAYETPSSGSTLFDMSRIGTGIMHPTKPTHILVSKRK
ncbi:Cytochrome P450 7B1 [Tulasnella sp. 424]|nr:Cytochrome P450 7B1 [Tulasnella sp. 424]KAG8973201.1 Cytochrome P450 7B1 [Tulasnella sp. 425]